MSLEAFAQLVESLSFEEIKVLASKNLVQVSYDSKREVKRSCLGCVPLSFAPALLAAGYFVYDKTSLPMVVTYALIGVGLFGGAIGAFLLFKTGKAEDKYVLDLGNEVIRDHRIADDDKHERVLFTFQDLKTLVLHSVYAYHQGSSEWRHGVSLISKKGSLLTLVEPAAQKREDMAKVGASLAELLGLEFEQGEEGSVFQYRESNEGLQYEFVPRQAPKA